MGIQRRSWYTMQSDHRASRIPANLPEQSGEAAKAKLTMAVKARIGVLALQGDFREHIRALNSRGAEAFPVRTPADLRGIDGLVIPGGESTVIGKLMVEYGLDQPLRELIAAGMPTWGTCAGLILLSQETDNAMAGQPLLATMHIRTRRNAFGPQRASFEADLRIPALGEQPYHAVFIRGPAVESVGEGVEVLARLDDSDNPESGIIVAVREGNVLGTAFHPEVTNDPRFHDYFLAMAQPARV
ncbi:MAG: Pyridoxal 5'-phosphate synthase (glutamine hydrolyzing), glutaminase subunit [Ktedonobacterales bacterium]|nr:MAG: Pyridoxal 5'-phosphate synthase (glutamine hydrolyzing), glutaminase subunit [Ktedonobacterales bacterium]